jgi:hypothetical protein
MPEAIAKGEQPTKKEANSDDCINKAITPVKQLA